MTIGVIGILPPFPLFSGKPKLHRDVIETAIKVGYEIVRVSSVVPSNARLMTMGSMGDSSFLLYQPTKRNRLWAGITITITW